MKRFLAIFIVLIVALSFGSGPKTKAMNMVAGSNTQGNTYDPAYQLNHQSVAAATGISDEKLEKIQIELTSDSMMRGEEQTVGLVGVYSGGIKKPIPFSAVEWTSSKSSVASISASKLQALTAGETTLIARYQNLMAIAIVQVQDFKELPHIANVDAKKIWNVKFNGPIDIQTVGNITVIDNNGSVIPVHYDYINRTYESIVQIIPKQNYTSGERYTIWVKDVQSLSGKPLEQFTKMDFTIKK